MKDTSPVQKIFTWAVVILVVILGIAVLVNNDKPTSYDRPFVIPSPDPAPIPVYPNNGKE